MKLPSRWKYCGEKKPFILYADDKLIVSFQMMQPRAGEATMHAAVSRVSGTRPSAKDMRRVEVDFFTASLGKVEERSLYECSELVRNLWQKVDVSVLTGDLLTPEMKARIEAVG